MQQVAQAAQEGAEALQVQLGAPGQEVREVQEVQAGVAARPAGWTRAEWTSAEPAPRAYDDEPHTAAQPDAPPLPPSRAA